MSLRGAATFNKITLPSRPGSVDDGTLALIRTLVDHQNDMAVKSNANKVAFERSSQIASPTIIIGGFGGSTSGSGGASSIFTHRAKKVSVSAGTQFVSFASLMTGDFVFGVIGCVGVEEIEGKPIMVGYRYKQSDVLSSGFTITVDADCIVDYLAVPSL